MNGSSLRQAVGWGTCVAFAMLCVLAVLPGRADAAYEWVREWPIPDRAGGLAVGADGVFITQGQHAFTEPAVQRYSPEGKLLRQWGEVGTEPGQLTDPESIAVDPSGRIWVVDGFGEIIVYTADGTRVDSRSITAPCGSELLVHDLDIDRLGEQYMTFYDNCDLVAGDTREGVIRSSSDWQVLSVWGDSGPNDGQFNSPGAVASDGRGHVYVADAANYRIQQFTPDGTFVRKWGQLGSGPGEFNGVADVAVSPDGDVFVADRTNQRIQRFTAEGTFVEAFEIPADVEYRGLPHSIDFDDQGNLYLLGTQGAETVDEVHVFAPSARASGARPAIARRALQVRRGRVAARLTCPAGAPCAGRVEVRRGRATVAAGRYRLGAGDRGTAVARLTKRGRALLKRRDTVAVTVVLRPQGDAAPVTRRLTLRR